MNKQAIHRLKITLSQCRKTMIRHQPGKKKRNAEVYNKASEVHENTLLKLKAHSVAVAGISEGKVDAA